jgi:hypothetical protein
MIQAPDVTRKSAATNLMIDMIASMQAMRSGRGA